MWNPFKKIKKAANTKLKKVAISAAIVAALTAAAVRFDIPIAKDTIDNLAAAITDAVVEVMDAPPEPPADAPVPESE